MHRPTSRRHFVFLANLVGFLGVIALPIAAAIDLLVRRRGRQLLEAPAALSIAALLVWLLAWWIQHASSGQLLIALTVDRINQRHAAQCNLAAIIAFITVARLVDKTRWAIASAGLVIAMFVANIVAGGITVAALALSALIGWALFYSPVTCLGEHQPLAQRT